MRLTQVLTNLCNNAAKYTNPGCEVCFTAAQEAQEVVLRVQDNGIGIPPEVLPRIFEPFFQAERPLDRPLSGLGIGLSAARQLVEMHGGTLEAYSAGADCVNEFVVRLPALK